MFQALGSHRGLDRPDHPHVACGVSGIQIQSCVSAGLVTGWCALESLAVKRLIYTLQPKRAAAAAGGVPKDDQYDYEDNFIDDSEIIEYYAGDRRKAKHSGFFVNSGEIEKVRHHVLLHVQACV
jgi:HPC2 and ubinuclein domain